MNGTHRQGDVITFGGGNGVQIGRRNIQSNSEFAYSFDIGHNNNNGPPSLSRRVSPEEINDGDRPPLVRTASVPPHGAGRIRFIAPVSDSPDRSSRVDKEKEEKDRIEREARARERDMELKEKTALLDQLRKNSQDLAAKQVCHSPPPSLPLLMRR
jgi:hypothetical protein